MKKMDVTKVAKVARIFLTEEETVRFQANLDVMLPWFDKMLQIDVQAGIKPVYSTTAYLAERNYFNDEVEKLITIEEVLFNAPEKQENLIIVPKVI